MPDRSSGDALRRLALHDPHRFLFRVANLVPAVASQLVVHVLHVVQRRLLFHYSRVSFHAQRARSRQRRIQSRTEMVHRLLCRCSYHRRAFGIVLRFTGVGRARRCRQSEELERKCAEHLRTQHNDVSAVLGAMCRYGYGRILLVRRRTASRVAQARVVRPLRRCAHARIFRLPSRPFP